MPELPEVETVRRTLEGALLGRVVERVEHLAPHLLWPASVSPLEQEVVGRPVQGVGRRGKFLWLELGGRSGRTERVLLVHLRMTGRLLFVPEGECWPQAAAGQGPIGSTAVADGRHVHAVLRLRGGGHLVFHDVRKFGRLGVFPPEALHSLLPTGLDPLLDPLDGQVLRRRADGRRMALKALLLRQDIVAGVGNIYADEVLHRARLHPAQPADSLSAPQWEALATALRAVLSEAVALGGTTLWDYRDARGRPGRFGRFLAVYGRWGQACRHCGTPIARTRLAGRTTCLCPRCQGGGWV